MPAVEFNFKGKNEKAQATAKAHGARMVRAVSEETRAAINAIMVRASEEGLPPRDTARLVRDLAGLTRRQSASVFNYYLRVRKDHPAKVARKLLDRYRDRKLKERGQVIARTETMGALNRGKLFSAYEAVDDGLFINPVKRWVLGLDEDTCKLCRPMQNEEVPLKDTFSNGYSAPPRHPQCRCTFTVTEGEVTAEMRENAAGRAKDVKALEAPAAE